MLDRNCMPTLPLAGGHQKLAHRVAGGRNHGFLNPSTAEPSLAVPI